MIHPNKKAGQRFLKWAWWLYGYLPDIAGNFLKKHYRYFLPFKDLRIPISILRGKTHLNSQEATVLFAGAENNEANYLINRFFDGQYKLERVEKVWLWNLASSLKCLRESTDLTIVRLDQLSARLFFNKDYLAVPEWVSLSLQVPHDLEKLSRRNHSLKDDLRIVRRNKLYPHFTQKKSDFNMFYSNMYMPFIRKRYGEDAYIRNFYQLRRNIRQGGFLFIMQKNKPIAGLIFKRRDQLLQVLALGILNGEWALVKAGALAATYFFIIERAKELGCKLIDFGGCRPSLKDGLLRYKRKWGMTLNDKPDSYYDNMMYLKSVNVEVISLLSNTPLIFRDYGGLSAISLIDCEKPATETEVCKAHHSMWMPGLSQLYLVSTSGWRQDTSSPLKTCLVDTKTLEDFKGRLFEEYHNRQEL